jgi:type VI protein secretion system component VasK
MSQNAPLLQALEIQQEDIDANRNGEFSPRQLRKLRGRVRARLLPLGAFAAMMLIATLFPLQGLLNIRNMEDSDSFSQFGWAIIFLLVLLAFFTIRQIVAEYRRENTKIASAQLKTIRGPVKMSVDTNDNGDALHTIRIGSQRFRVIPPVYEAFEPKARYTLYYTSTTSEIVGAEREE